MIQRGPPLNWKERPGASDQNVRRVHRAFAEAYRQRLAEFRDSANTEGPRHTPAGAEAGAARYLRPFFNLPGAGHRPVAFARDFASDQIGLELATDTRGALAAIAD